MWLGSINISLSWQVLASDCDWLSLFSLGLVIMVNLLPQALKQLTLIFFMQKVSSPNMVLRQRPNLIIGESTEAAACGLASTLFCCLLNAFFLLLACFIYWWYLIWLFMVRPICEGCNWVLLARDIWFDVIISLFNSLTSSGFINYKRFWYRF